MRAMRVENAERLGGLAALLAGVLLIISELLGFLPSGFLPLGLSGYELAISGWLGINGYLGVLLAVLLQLGLVGLYVPNARAAGVLGAVGFFMAFIGSRLAIGPSFIDPIIEPSLFLGPLMIFVVGWVLVGVAMFRSRAYPRSGVALLIVGALVLLLPLPLSGAVFAVALAWVGYIIFAGQGGREAPRPTHA